MLIKDYTSNIKTIWTQNLKLLYIMYIKAMMIKMFKIYIIKLLMKLSKIEEEKLPLKHQYYQTILNKQSPIVKGTKIIYDWQMAETNLISLLPQNQETLELFIELQKACQQEPPSFYTYFFVRQCLDGKESKPPINEQIKALIQELKEKKSSWHKIMHLVKIRQNLLKKLHSPEQKHNQYIDDLRFVNLQLIRKINEWKNANTCLQNPVFIVNGNNYLIQMLSDNSSVIGRLNRKKVIYIPPPNPFFLTQDGKKISMASLSQQEIQESMEILAKQKAEELKLLLQPPKYIRKNNNELEELQKLKKQLENEKTAKIINAYKPRSTTSKKNLKNSSKHNFNTKQIHHDEKLEFEKPYFSTTTNKLQRMIQQKEVFTVKSMKKSDLNKKEQKKEKNSVLSKIAAYNFRINQLKKSVESNQATKNKKSLIRLTDLKTEQKNKNIRMNIQNNTFQKSNSSMKFIGQRQSSPSQSKQLPSKNLQMYRARKSLTSFIQPIHSLKEGDELNKKNENIQTDKQIYKKKYKIDFKKERANKYSQKKKSITHSQSITEEKQKLKNQKDTIDDELRAVKSRLKQISIKKVYGKNKKSPSVSLNKKKNEYHSKSNLNEGQKREEIQKVKEKNKQIKFQKIQNLNQSSKKDKKLKNTKQVLLNQQFQKKKQQEKKTSEKINHNLQNLKRREERIIQENKEQEQYLETKKTEKLQLLKQLSKRDEKISQLLDILKKQQRNEANILMDEELINFKKQKEEKIEKIQLLKQKASIETIQLEKDLKKEQQRYLELKQQQYAIHERDLEKKYEKNLNEIREQYLQKNKVLQQRIIKQEQTRRQNEMKIFKERQEMEKMRLQLEQKNLKEHLLTEILEEQRTKIQQQKEEDILERELQKERIRQEMIQKSEIQKQAIENIQLNNQRLMQIFEETRIKNKKLEDQNRRKLQQIDDLSRLIEQKEMNSEQTLKQGQVQNQSKDNRVQKSQILEEPQLNQLQDIESLKIRIKQEILREMTKKKQEEIEEENRYKIERMKKVQQMEEEIKNIFKKQQEELQAIEKQKQLAEIRDQGKHQLNEQERQQKEKYQEQMKKVLSELQSQQNKKQEQVEQAEQKIKENNSNAKDQFSGQKQSEKNQVSQQQKDMKKKLEQSDKEREKLSQKKEQFSEQKQEQKQKLISQEKNSQKMESKDQQKQESQQQIQNERLQVQKQQSKNERLSETQKKQQEKDVKTEQQKQQSKNEQKNLSDNEEEKTKKQKPKSQQPQNSLIKPMLPVKQQTEEIILKYKELKQFIKPKCKQIYIEDTNSGYYINNLFQSFPVQVREMIPYEIEELKKTCSKSSSKIDIFDCNSIGWQSSDRYILLGDIGCVDLIARKYGSVQIETVFHFNKTNPYQKQYLIKQLKIYQKVGYVYQKKLSQENMVSIKCIIKIPSQTKQKHQKNLTKALSIVSKINIQQHSVEGSTKKISLSYLLSQTLKNALHENERKQFQSSARPEDRLIVKKMQLPIFTDQIFVTNQINDRMIESEFKIQLNYIQTHEYPCYLLRTSQISGAKGQKMFMCQITEDLVILIIQEFHQEYGLDIFLETIPKNVQTEREILACVPIWKTNKKEKLSNPGNKPFTYSYNISPPQNYGSIIDTSIQKKEGYKPIQTPFIFSLFQIHNKTLIRPLTGQIVEHSDLINVKR